MKEHITDDDLSAVMERFNQENPNADSFELARYMFNLGYEAGERGGIPAAATGRKNAEDVCYQPVEYFDDGTNIMYGDMPEELSSFQAFRTYEDCEDWLLCHGYIPGDYAIIEYKVSDIEDVVLL